MVIEIKDDTDFKTYVVNLQYKCSNCGRQFCIAFPADGEWEEAEGECFQCGQRYYIKEHIPSVKMKCVVDYAIDTDKLMEDKGIKEGEKFTDKIG